jgi:hypothetical protein
MSVLSDHPTRLARTPDEKRGGTAEAEPPLFRQVVLALLAIDQFGGLRRRSASLRRSWHLAPI